MADPISDQNRDQLNCDTKARELPPACGRVWLFVCVAVFVCARVCDPVAIYLSHDKDIQDFLSILF